MKNASETSSDSLRTDLLALSRALSEVRDSLTLLALALEDCQFERDIPSRLDARHAATRLLRRLQNT